MRILLFIIPALFATSLVLIAAVLGNEQLRRLVFSILLLLWALIRWPFEALFGLFRRK